MCCIIVAALVLNPLTPLLDPETVTGLIVMALIKPQETTVSSKEEKRLIDGVFLEFGHQLDIRKFYFQCGVWLWVHR